jgi:hypothetical protein
MYCLYAETLTFCLKKKKKKKEMKEEEEQKE